MVASGEDPGRGRQQGCARGEELGLPGPPPVAEGTSGALGLSGRTGRFAIVVVADVHHEVRLLPGRQGRDPGEGPAGDGIVAVLDQGTFQAAAGVAQDHDAVGRAFGYGQDLALQVRDPRAPRQGGDADAIGEGLGRGGAQPHGMAPAIDHQPGADGRRGDHPDLRAPPGDLHPGRGRLGGGDAGQGQGREQSRQQLHPRRSPSCRETTWRPVPPSSRRPAH